MWLTALLALGAVLVLSTPLLFVRRRKQQAAVQGAAAKPRPSQPRRLVDPHAGIEVVEGQLARAPSSAKTVAPAAAPTARVAAPPPVATPPRPLVISIGPTDPVDLDVGLPVMVDERIDWFGERADAVTGANPSLTDVTAEVAATARMPELDDADRAKQQMLAKPKPEVEAPAIDDEQHTLTIVELDMLRQDYEAEHTMTQASNKALRDAVADLRATQAAQTASSETATIEMPQPQAEMIETQPTQRLRSSR